MISVREATQSDVADIVLLGKALHKNSSYACKAFSDDKASSMVSMMIDSESDCALVAEDEQEVIGYFLGGLNYEWFSDELLAFDYSVYVSPLKRNGWTAIKLFDLFERWAKEKGATFINIGVTTAINENKTTRFYNYLGYENAGVFFEKRI